MQSRRAIRALLAHFAGRRAAKRRGGFEWTPEAERLRAALEMHECGVQLYRQRMRREHPGASHDELDALVRRWLISPPPAGRLRLPSREQGHRHAR
ncbi:hypothetical protein [Actinomadura sp. NBRC 104412]|uniref:hypothetical protein n=1 Tax=Actinomadura sp. NBRC 104412 TaxID=3032203 RepID=UPI00331D49B5